MDLDTAYVGLGFCFFADFVFALILGILVLIVVVYTSCVSSFYDKISGKLLLVFDAF
jgi:hypothetical protein